MALSPRLLVHEVARPTQAPSEADLQRAVIDLARMFGWRIAHFRPAHTAKGWRTPVEADGKGWPDLVMIRPPRIVIAELKVGRNQVTEDQATWLELFRQANLETHVWRETDLRGSILDTLR